MQLFLYVGFYNNVDVYDLHEAGLWYHVLSITYDINKDVGDMHEFIYS